MHAFCYPHIDTILSWGYIQRHLYTYMWLHTLCMCRQLNYRCIHWEQSGLVVINIVRLIIFSRKYYVRICVTTAWAGVAKYTVALGAVKISIMKLPFNRENVWNHKSAMGRPAYDTVRRQQSASACGMTTSSPFVRKIDNLEICFRREPLLHDRDFLPPFRDVKSSSHWKRVKNFMKPQTKLGSAGHKWSKMEVEFGCERQRCFEAFWVDLFPQDWSGEKAVSVFGCAINYAVFCKLQNHFTTVK